MPIVCRCVDPRVACRQVIEADVVGFVCLQPGPGLGGDISAETFEFINQALLKYKVLFFRDQHLDDAEHEAFSRRFGDQVPHPTVRSAEQSAAILHLDAKETRANSWHTDVTFVANYPKISILRGVVIPPAGGDTRRRGAAPGPSTCIRPALCRWLVNPQLQGA